MYSAKGASPRTTQGRNFLDREAFDDKMGLQADCFIIDGNWHPAKKRSLNSHVSLGHREVSGAQRSVWGTEKSVMILSVQPSATQPKPTLCPS